jgi:hypothetical protein
MNEYALWPLYVIQDWCRNHQSVMVGYAEAIKKEPSPEL